MLKLQHAEKKKLAADDFLVPEMAQHNVCKSA